MVGRKAAQTGAAPHSVTANFRRYSKRHVDDKLPSQIANSSAGAGAGKFKLPCCFTDGRFDSP